MNPADPDVVALSLDAALEAMRGAGIEVDVRKTYPAKPFPGNGRWRVVRQQNAAGKAMLVAAEECEGVSAGGYRESCVSL